MGDRFDCPNLRAARVVGSGGKPFDDDRLQIIHTGATHSMQASAGDGWLLEPDVHVWANGYVAVSDHSAKSATLEILLMLLISVFEIDKGQVEYKLATY